MGMLDGLLYGIRTILADGVEQALRSKLNFRGGVEIADDAANDRTNVTIIRSYAAYTLAGTAIASGSKFTLTQRVNQDFSLASDEITVPAVGKYLVSVYAKMQGSSTSNPLLLHANLQLNGTNVEFLAATRFSASASDFVASSLVGIVDVTNVTHKLRLLSANSNITMNNDSRLVIRRLA